MTNFFESLRIDLRGSGVDVTVITPGFVKSPMTDQNRHPMPFLMDLDPAVDRMARAIHERKKSLAFPWQLATLARLGRLLPRPAYDWLLSRVDRGKSPEAGGPPEGRGLPEAGGPREGRGLPEAGGPPEAGGTLEAGRPREAGGPPEAGGTLEAGRPLEDPQAE